MNYLSFEPNLAPYGYIPSGANPQQSDGLYHPVNQNAFISNNEYQMSNSMYHPQKLNDEQKGESHQFPHRQNWLKQKQKGSQER